LRLPLFCGRTRHVFITTAESVVKTLSKVTLQAPHLAMRDVPLLIATIELLLVSARTKFLKPPSQ
jgi:hypothetical protein